MLGKKLECRCDVESLRNERSSNLRIGYFLDGAEGSVSGTYGNGVDHCRYAVAPSRALGWSDSQIAHTEKRAVLFYQEGGHRHSCQIAIVLQPLINDDFQHC